jgi:DNA-binding transcriptional ArsR family regulator
MPTQLRELEAVGRTETAELLLHPLRQRILQEAVDPSSASEIARRIGDTPQKVNYHVRTLVEAGLLVPAGEQRKRNLTEKRYRATARSYVLLPGVLGRVSAETRRVTDELSATHLLQLSAVMQAELGATMDQDRSSGSETPTLALDAELRFESRRQRAAFASALREAVAEVIARYTAPARTDDGRASPGRPYRLVLGCYPVGGTPGPTDERTQYLETGT